MKLFLVCLFSFVTLHAQPLRLETSATGAILINGKTGKVLYEKQPHKRLFPASTTKIATVYYFLEKKGSRCLDEMVVVPRECLAMVSQAVRQNSLEYAYYLEPGGQSMGLVEGEKVSYRSLLHGTLLWSGNDAANVLAYYCSGSIPKFIEELNAFLKKKGLSETHFVSPHGCHYPEHYTTVADMALLAREAMKNPVFREIAKAESYTKPANHQRPAQILTAHNHLIQKNSRYYYPKAIGIKTGWTVPAGQNLVAAAEDENRYLIAVHFGCPDRTKRFTDVIRLFDAAYAEKKVSRVVFAKGCDRFSVAVKGGKAPLQAALGENLLLSYYPSEEPKIKTKLTWQSPQMPIYAGDPVGYLEIMTEEGEVIQRGALVALEAVEPTLFFAAGQFFHSWRLVFGFLLLFSLAAGGVAYIIWKPSARL